MNPNRTASASRGKKLRGISCWPATRDEFPTSFIQNALYLGTNNLCDEIAILKCSAVSIPSAVPSSKMVGNPPQSQESVRTLQLQLEEQQAKRNGSEQLIGHLREELERLQSENAEEWGRRERLDAEKQVFSHCFLRHNLINDGRAISHSFPHRRTASGRIAS